MVAVVVAASAAVASAYVATVAGFRAIDDGAAVAVAAATCGEHASPDGTRWSPTHDSASSHAPGRSPLAEGVPYCTAFCTTLVLMLDQGWGLRSTSLPDMRPGHARMRLLRPAHPHAQALCTCAVFRNFSMWTSRT